MWIQNFSDPTDQVAAALDVNLRRGILWQRRLEGDFFYGSSQVDLGDGNSKVAQNEILLRVRSHAGGEKAVRIGSIAENVPRVLRMWMRGDARRKAGRYQSSQPARCLESTTMARWNEMRPLINCPRGYTCRARLNDLTSDVQESVSSNIEKGVPRRNNRNAFSSCDKSML